MPLQLNTPFDPGDADQGASYTHIKIMDINISIRTGAIRVVAFRGSLDGGEFVRGPASEPIDFEITGGEYQAMVDALPANTTVTLYNQVAELLYDYMGPLGYDGVIV